MEEDNRQMHMAVMKKNKKRRGDAECLRCVKRSKKDPTIISSK
jgi:hypothetical protein